MSFKAMTQRLEGKTVVITGASSGIGKATALEFASSSPNNLKLVLTARRLDTLKQIANDIEKKFSGGVKVLPVRLDVSDPENVRSFVSSLPTEFQEIDILVNNAYVTLELNFGLRLKVSQRHGQGCSESARH